MICDADDERLAANLNAAVRRLAVSGLNISYADLITVTRRLAD